MRWNSVNLFVYLLYEQYGLEKIEVEVQVCKAPAIELAYKKNKNMDFTMT